MQIIKNLVKKRHLTKTRNTIDSIHPAKVIHVKIPQLPTQVSPIYNKTRSISYKLFSHHQAMLSMRLCDVLTASESVATTTVTTEFTTSTATEFAATEFTTLVTTGVATG